MFSKITDGNFLVIGYVARDAEMKTTQSGKTMTRWSVAAAKIKTADGNYETKWTSCQAWHDVARAAASIRRGDTVLCAGRMESHEYEGKTYKDLIVDFFCKMPSASVQEMAASDPESISAEDDLSDFETILGDSEPPF